MLSELSRLDVPRRGLLGHLRLAKVDPRLLSSRELEAAGLRLQQSKAQRGGPRGTRLHAVGGGRLPPVKVHDGDLAGRERRSAAAQFPSGAAARIALV